MEPGAYAFTKYNPTSAVNSSNFGNVIILDTGLSNTTMSGGAVEFELAGGSGFNGQLRKDIKSVYEFDSYEAFKSFMGGGKACEVARKLFDPLSGTPDAGAPGIPKLYYVRAASTTPATAVIHLDAGDTSANVLTLTCKNEGAAGNGISVDGVLKSGYQIKTISKTSGVVLQIWKGTFEGEDEFGEFLGSKDTENSVPIMIFESEEATDCKVVYDEILNNKEVQKHFIISGSNITAGTEFKTTAAVSTSGGVTNFFTTADEFDTIFEAISEIDITAFLCVDKGVSTLNDRIYAYIKGGMSKFTNFMFVPGGESYDDIFGTEDSETSEYIAKYYNSEQAITVHGSPELVRNTGNGDKQLSSLYLTASILGMICGGSPQTPPTFKKVGYQNFVYALKQKERIKALQLGILHLRNVNGYWVINQGVTTLQDNKQTIALDGQSLEISIALIKAQLNKELILDAEPRFTGKTAAQADPESVKNFTETKLASLVAKKGADNLIISWKNVKVSGQNGDYTVTYDFVPNVPVNKTFFIGNMLDFKF